MTGNAPAAGRRIVYGVTVGTSAFTLLRGQLAWLKDQGWDVTLVASPDEAAERTAEREGVRFHGIDMSRRISPVADLTSLRRWVTFLRQAKPDVVNASTPKAGLLGHLAAWLTRVRRRIYVVRGLRLEGAHGPVAVVLWLMERLTIGLATDVVFVSASLAQEAQRRRLIKPGAAWIIGEGSSNGIDSDGVARRIARVDPRQLRASLGLAPDAFVVGFVGRVVTDKGVDTLVRAFGDPDLDPRARLLLIGPLEEPELEESIHSLGDRAVWLRWVDDVWGHLPALDVLCLPSRREGLPTVVLEAAAAGVPAIVSRATGAVESVVDGETGILIDVDDHSGLVKAVNALASDAHRPSALGSAARERAVLSFGQDRFWRGLHGILAGDVDPTLVRRI
jgi:glycosyltransferase involved in cell wall biosynthesis